LLCSWCRPSTLAGVLTTRSGNSSSSESRDL
jgi:hypothetical protein